MRYRVKRRTDKGREEKGVEGCGRKQGKMNVGKRMGEI